MIAIRQRPGLFVDELGLLIADLLQPLLHVGVGDFRLGIGDGDAAVVAQIEIRRDLELGLETQRLAGVQVNIGDIRPPHHLQVVLFHGGVEEAREPASR